MKSYFRAWVCLAALALVILAAPAQAAEGKRPSKKYWVISVLVMAAATSADLLTSSGHIEVNPLMRSADGRFNSRRGLALKLGISGALLGLQAYVIRRDPSPDILKAAAAANFAASGAFALTAARNCAVPKP